MEKDDLLNCQYIEDYLRFLTFNDFCSNCRAIKSYYRRFDRTGKRFYKWYVYANIYLNEGQKNDIWNYLNSEEPDCMDRYLHLSTKTK